MLGGTTNGRTMPVTKSLDGLAKIAEQVPSISDLDSAGRTLAGTVGIRTCTIAGDDLNTWAILQPGGERRSSRSGRRSTTLFVSRSTSTVP